MKPNDKKNQVREYMFLSMSLLIICGCPKKTGDDNADTMHATTLYKTEGYKKVLVIHSYYPDYGWVQSITRGLHLVLDSQNVDLQFFYMDSKRNPNKEWMVEQGEKAIHVIGQWNPDVVITVDDNAQEYVGKVLARTGKIAVVFCGVNSNPKRYGYPVARVTGVIEQPHFNESVSLLSKILKKGRPLRLVVMSDCSETTDFVFDAMKAQVDPGVEVLEWCKPVTWKEWQEKVQQAQSRADAIAIYLYHTILPDPDSKQSMNPQDVIAWTTKNSSIPILGFMPYSAEDGSLCGVLESGMEQGKMAGQMAVKILKGAVPASLEIQTSLVGQPMLNLDAAGNLGIHVSGDIISQSDILIGIDDKKESF